MVQVTNPSSHLTVVALCPGASPVPPPALRRVGVPLDHRGNEAGVADWKRREDGGVKGRWADRLLVNGAVLTDSSVLVTVLIPVVSLIIQV